MYFARYFRYIPPFALLLVLFTSSLPHLIADGPSIEFLNREITFCQEYWWSSLLLVQNYVNVNTVVRIMSFEEITITKFLITVPPPHLVPQR